MSVLKSFKRFRRFFVFSRFPFFFFRCRARSEKLKFVSHDMKWQKMKRNNEISSWRFPRWHPVRKICYFFCEVFKMYRNSNFWKPLEKNVHKYFYTVKIFHDTFLIKKCLRIFFSLDFSETFVETNFSFPFFHPGRLRITRVNQNFSQTFFLVFIKLYGIWIHLSWQLMMFINYEFIATLRRFLASSC